MDTRPTIGILALVVMLLTASLGCVPPAIYEDDYRLVFEDHFATTRDVRTTIPHAVQIISGYKAKGSEWDAVIVPYFARGVTVKAAPYPRMLRHPHTREFMARHHRSLHERKAATALALSSAPGVSSVPDGELFVLRES